MGFNCKTRSLWGFCINYLALGPAGVLLAQDAIMPIHLSPDATEPCLSKHWHMVCYTGSYGYQPQVAVSGKRTHVNKERPW